MSVGRRVGVVLGVAAIGLGAALPAPAAGKRAGDVVVVERQGSSVARSRGGSATVFSLALPVDAACPGDSADDNYRVQSFVVPASVDPASLRYKSQGPDVPGGWALYKRNTSAYIQEQTQNAEKPGEPGVIVALPDLSFEVWKGAEPLVGRYRVGVACTLLNETVTYWGTEMVFTEDASDAPAKFRWRAVGAAQSAAASRSDGGLGDLAPVALVAVVLAGVALFVVRARRGRA